MKSSVINDLLKLLEANIHSTANISKYSRDLGYTPEALIRLFKKVIGVSPGHYHRNLRLTSACELLTNSHSSIKEIAQLCGFESQNYLSRIFKQVLGVTPGHYRDNPNLVLLESIAKVHYTRNL
ncbi:MAG: AraC family transcriptional regulator [Victivallaceae bacterium]|nr:AraC family transcriptional regulator [Victivallaceae bacterium]